MLTKAVRIYGKNDLRLEEFELPPIMGDEILASVVSDCICMSSHKAAISGTEHKRIPDNVATHPTILGHEFSGEILQVGTKWQNSFFPGQKYAIQPALNYRGSLNAPGYSYRFIGGNATRIIIPNEVMEQGCLLPYDGDAFFKASLTEPMSCIIGAFHGCYHTERGSYEHNMGIVRGGNMAILGGGGSMGLGAIDYAIHCSRKPGLLVVTDIDDEKLKRAAQLLTAREAAAHDVRLIYVNSSDASKLISITGGHGFDDVFVYAPDKGLIELADKMLAKDGCLNFFAGPVDLDFSASLNFYNIHYASTHVVGTTGGNTGDMLEALSMMKRGLINPAAMITHIGGIDAVIDTTMNLPNLPGFKKLIYTGINMPLTAIEDFARSKKAKHRKIAEIVEANNGLWCAAAERELLKGSYK